MTRSLAVFVVFSLVGAASVLGGWDEGVAALRSGDFERAVSEFQAVVQAQSELASAHFMLGLALSKLGRQEEALGHHRRAYELEPAQLSFRLTLAKGYVELRQYPEAAELLEGIDALSLPDAQRMSFLEMAWVAYEKSDGA